MNVKSCAVCKVCKLACFQTLFGLSISSGFSFIILDAVVAVSCSALVVIGLALMLSSFRIFDIHLSSSELFTSRNVTALVKRTPRLNPFTLKLLARPFMSFFR